MKTHKFVQDLNIDGVSIKITSDSANSIAGTATPETPMLEPQLVFGEKEVTIGDFPIGWSGTMGALVFREIKNGNDRFAVCTGFRYGDDWYLDRPDDGEFIDPFDNMAKKQVLNGKITASGSTGTSAPTDTEEEPAQPPAEPEREKFVSYEEFFEWAKAEAAKLKSSMCSGYTYTKPVRETKGPDQYSVTFEDTCTDQVGGSIRYSVVAPFYKNTVQRRQISGVAT